MSILGVLMLAVSTVVTPPAPGGAATGRGFYSASETPEVVLKRLLMYGVSDGGGMDIPAGDVMAFPEITSTNPVAFPVGVGYSSIHQTDEEVFSR